MVPYSLPYIAMRTSPIIVGVVGRQMLGVRQHPAHPRFLRRCSSPHFEHPHWQNPRSAPALWRFQLTYFVYSSVVTVGFSSNMYTVVESDGYVEVCVQVNSDVGSLPSGSFVTFSITVTPSTAGEKMQSIYATLN